MQQLMRERLPRFLVWAKVQVQQLTRERLPRFQHAHTKKKNKKNRKRKIPKKIEKGKIQKIEKRKNSKKIRKRKHPKNQEKKKNLFPVVLDKICVFCLYPIPDSQQCVKRGSCRRQILSGLLCLFLFWASGPFVMSFEFGPRTLSVFTFIESLSRFQYQLFYFVFVSHLFVICR